MLNKKTSNNDFLTSFLSYYIVILCIPLLVGIGLYIYGSLVIQDEVTNANKLVIEQLKLSIDQQLEGVQDFTIQLGSDNTLDGILYARDELTTAHRYTLIYLTNNFKAYNVSNEFITDFLVFFDNSDTLLGPGGYVNVEGIRDSVFYDNAWYFPNWYNVLHSEHRSELYPIYLENTEEVESILYLQSLPLNRFNDYEGTIALQLNTDYLNNLILSTQESNKGIGTFVIKDASNKIIYSNGDSDVVSVIKSGVVDDINDGFVSINKRKDYYVYTIDSGVSSWQYTTIIPSSEFNKRILFLRYIGVLSLLVILLLSMIAIWLVKKRRYDPLASTIKLLRNDDSYSGEVDAFAYIRSTVEQTISDKTVMEETMLNNKDYLQSYFIMRLLSQKVVDEETQRRLSEYYGIDLSHTYTGVVIFYLNTQDDKALAENERFVEFLSKMKETFEENMNKEESLAGLYPVYVNGMLVCLMNYAKEIHDDNTILHWLNSLKSDMDDIDISVSMSLPKTTMLEINHAYDEAIQALERKLVYGKSGVSQYRSSHYSAKITQIKYYQYEDNFTVLLDGREFEKAKNVINNLFNLVLNQENMNINIVKCRMFGIINILMNTIEKLDLPSDVISFDEIYSKLVGFYSIEELREEILSVISTLKKEASINNKAIEGDLLVKVDHFVSKHYQDPNLSVSLIAEEYKMDLSILSRKFKKEKKINLSDYIHLKRLEHAKPMLIEGKDTIKTIAVRCGYLNSDVFIRVFKRYEGLTPGKYRAKHKE